MTPGSTTLLSLPGYIIFWVMLAIVIGLFITRIYFLIHLLRLGKPESRFDQLGQRIIHMLWVNISQWCSLKNVSLKELAGIGHAFMLWGFALFVVYYFIYIGLKRGLGLSIPSIGSPFERVLFSILDVAALVVIVTVIGAAIKYFITKPERLVRKEDPEGTKGKIILIILLTIMTGLMVFYYLMEGYRYAANNITTSWPPIVGALAKCLIGRGLPTDSLLATYETIWWINYIILLAVLIYIPRSKHLHPLFAPANMLFKAQGPKNVLEPLPLEETETFGVSKIQDFTWKQLLDLFSCTWCGRCHINCPAQLSGKTLSPREIILNLKEHLLEEGPKLLAGKAEASTEDGSKAMIGGVITEEEIWACTTCSACQEVCPVNIEHIRKIIDLRRNLVLTQGKMPESAQLMLRNMQLRGHPWVGVQSLRLRGDWTSGLELNILAEGDQADTLLWVGCTGALVERNVNATLSMTRVLRTAGVDFGVLGEAETCCGDPARRAGNEFQFQILAEQNIEVFKNHNIKEIITLCPHCYHSLKNEYPKFGGEFKVVHYTQLIADLIRQGKLKLTKGLKARLTYHDPCYLGRYSGIYQEPREILKSIPQTKLEEMERSKEMAFCCGGGGGLMWIEEQPGTTKINHVRIEDVLKTGAETVITACPYCLQMFEEAIEHKEKKDSLKAKDLVEIVEEAMK